MIGFHIDMNTARFNKHYLEKWLRELAELGYDTIIWEVEDNITWETCPECVSVDAFSKSEFRELVSLCRSLKMEPIPLLQSMAHCEYVLKHDKYKHLAESEDRIEQYCPRNHDLISFIQKWIDEYIDLFGEIKFFHLGADETSLLGTCDACRNFVQKHSLSELYVNYVNEISDYLIKRNITPIIWADMVLKQPEALPMLSPKIMLFDWMYGIYRGNGKVWIWGTGLCSAEKIPAKAKKTFGQALFPDGDEPGRVPETYYSADFLTENGFKVITCPGSSSYSDSLFAPRHWLHMKNTFDSFCKAKSGKIAGFVLTSWTVHLFPWELQTACFDIPSFMENHYDGNIDAYQIFYSKKRFGIKDTSIFSACGLLSKCCPFSSAASIGHSKAKLPISQNFIQAAVRQLDNNSLAQEIDNCRYRLEEYRDGYKLMCEFSEKATKGYELLKWWNLAARNLINRAEASAFLLKLELASRYQISLQADCYENGKRILDELKQLKKETSLMYDSNLKASCRDEIIGKLFDGMEYAMFQVIKEFKS